MDAENLGDKNLNEIIVSTYYKIPEESIQVHSNRQRNIKKLKIKVVLAQWGATVS